MGIDGAGFLLLLAVVAALQAWLPGRGRVVLLLVASLAFYALLSIGHLALLLGLCGLNYWACVRLSQDADGPGRTRVFATTILINLAVLIVFKYAAGPVGELLGRLGYGGVGGVVKLALPLGISYFSFQMLACVTDAYWGTWRLKHGFTRFALFGFFFPQISSGPIPRAGRLLPQLAAGGFPTAEDRLAGARLIAYGFFKKYVVANRVNEYVLGVFNQTPLQAAETSTIPAVIACCLNALQIYADFSGYVDIAIGSACFLGFRLDPNFDRPYLSTSVTDFWRRWHMTLSFWLRDYLYVPVLMQVRNFGKFGIFLALVVTFVICGLWHGATWNYALFGLAQGLALSAETLTKSWRTKKLKAWSGRWVIWSGRCYALGFFVLSQVLFRASNLPEALRIYRRLIHLHVSGGMTEFLASRPFFLALDILVIGCWIGIAALLRRQTNGSGLGFILLCFGLILFLGRLAEGHFIYAAF